MITTLRSAVAQLDSLYKSAQCSVVHKTYGTQDVLGEESTSSTTRKAFVFDDDSVVALANGETRRARHRILFTGNVPVNPRDEIVLPAPKFSGPILSVNAQSDPAGGVLFTVVMMG